LSGTTEEQEKTMAATARISRDLLPQPKDHDPDAGHGGELQAVDAVYAAYMAMNATGNSPMAWQNNATSPMSLLARAGVAALGRLPGVAPRDAKAIWNAMCDGGSDARWCYDLWRKGQI
jgi:hypothetical protein